MPILKSNPFQYGSVLKPSQLVNRKEELRETERAMTTQGRLFLLGPRRHGKTAVLNAATRTAEAAGATVLFVDAEGCADMGDLAQTLVKLAAKLLKGELARAGEVLLHAFARLRPAFSYDPATGEWSATIEGAARKEAIPTFIETLEGIAKLAQTQKRPVAVVLDEFQRVIEWGGEAAEAQVRAAVQRHNNLGFVFAGSRTTLINDMTLNPAPPFYRLGERLMLGPLPREEFRPYLTRGFEKAGFKVSPQGVEAILDLACDVPYNVQALAYHAWYLMQDSEVPLLDEAVVTKALELLVAHDQAFYLTLWNSLTKVQHNVLRAAVTEGGRQLTSVHVQTKYGVQASTVLKTLRFLEERQILRRQEEGRTTLWLPEDPFFAAWIQR